MTLYGYPPPNWWCPDCGTLRWFKEHIPSALTNHDRLVQALERLIFDFEEATGLDANLARAALDALKEKANG